MTYNDYEYTGLVFRLEQSFSTKEPGQLSGNSPARLLQQRDACTTPSNPDGLIPHFATGNPAVSDRLRRRPAIGELHSPHLVGDAAGLRDPPQALYSGLAKHGRRRLSALDSSGCG